MKASFTVQDGITPAVRALIKKLDSPGRKKVMEVIGMALRDWATEAFTNASMRPAVWPAKRDGTASTLQGKSPVLRRSLRVDASDSEVTIGSDRAYALIHQVGGVIKPHGKALVFKVGDKTFFAKQVTIPARPYLPVDQSGNIMAAAAEDAMAAAMDELTAGTP